MAQDGLRGLVKGMERAGDIGHTDKKVQADADRHRARMRDIGDQSLRGFLERLEKRDELIRFDKQVDPATNMAAVEWKAYDQLGKGSLFTNILGHPGWQACSQVLADRRKWAIALSLTEGGSYTLTVGVHDVQDQGYDSGLILDFFRLVRSPEPGTFGTVAGGLLVLNWLARRRQPRA